MVTRPARIVTVSNDDARAELLAALLADAIEHEVIFVESLEHAYSRVKTLIPDLVILFLTIDDAAACQVLSMLKLDRETSGIPVVTWVANRTPGAFEEVVAAVGLESTHPFTAVVAS